MLQINRVACRQSVATGRRWYGEFHSSEIRFQSFGKGGEGMDAYNISAREQVHRNGNVTQHISLAGQALGINIGSESDLARENGRNWPLYTIESNRITVRAVVRESEVLAEWDVPAEFTEECS